MTTFQVDFQPIGRRGPCRPDESLLELTRELGVDLISLCGGHGLCARCRVQIVDGEVSPPTDADEEHLSERELADGFRLACGCYPRSDCTVGVPPESLSTAMRSQIESREAEVALAPLVVALELTLPRPSLEHPLADADSLLAAASAAGHPELEAVDLAVLTRLSGDLRAWDWSLTALARGREVIAALPPGSRAVGLAVDFGTTGVAGYLLDLGSGEVLASRGTMNPQIAYGEDIVSRITYARKSPEQRARLREVAVAGLNRLAAELCAEAGLASTAVAEAVVVGNTAMHHLLTGLPTEQLALAPFVPATSGSLEVRARDLGLELAPGAYLCLLPNIAGFIGGDHVAMLLATAGEWRGRCAIALDIGTNTEISLALPDGALRSLSCASGPAFEGYHIKDGTRATVGAIERVQITADTVRYQTIGGAEPGGICGSGILDAIGQLHLAGVLSPNGRIQLGTHPRVRETDETREFVLVPEAERGGRKAISVTQEDVREILLAKAAIQTGIEVLLAESGIEAGELDTIVIAGAFGSYIDVENAIAIGLFPPLPLERFRQVGNAAGLGAKLALASAAVRAEARDLLDRVDYLELASYPGFSRLFGQNCRLAAVAEPAR
ncbi:MAG: DUF4445 domain-containing protein [Thermoleophilia bacterium]|nr:DUF4445 domain-containing protein [Thermoleophilia bacterium]